MTEAPRSTAGARPGFSLRRFVRSSPWVLMALLLHALVVTVLSVIFISAQRGEREQAPLTVAVQSAARALPPEEVVAPRIVVPDRVPVLPSDPDEALVREEELLPDTFAGRPGEVTDELDPTLDPGHVNPDPDALSNLPSGDKGGTPIGVGSVGHRGLGVSAFSSRVAGEGGAGDGGLGEGARNRGETRDTEQAVLTALEWLKRHQAPDGNWDCDAFAAQCTSEACSGAGSGVHDVGVTGLALLAFLGAGHTHIDGAFRATVRKGLAWLIAQQDDEGAFGARIGQGFLYDHACATLAMAEAYGMTGAKLFRDSAQPAIRFVLRAQNPYSAWRYAAPGDGDNDTSVTGWMVMALKSAKLAGLTIDDAAFDGALAWIEQMTDPASGRTGYTEVGGRSSRLASAASQFPVERKESMTAVGVLSRIFGGRTSESDPEIRLGAELLAASPPRWNERSGHVDFYYWYYGTLAMFQLGGARWERWNEALREAVVAHQEGDPSGCASGSWAPLDPWSAVGGRVYATALNCLTLEVYYRYPRVVGARK